MPVIDAWQDLAKSYGLDTALEDEIRKRFKSITIESAYGPTIVLDDPLKKGPPNPFLEKLQPKITVNVKGAKPIVLAPYGTPGPTKWPMIKNGTLLGGALLLALLAKAIIRN